MKLIIVRPTSSVDCERSFSNMRIVNNWLRNYIELNRLNSVMISKPYQRALMICSIKSETLDELNINELMSSFVKKSEWREKMFSFH